MLSAYEKAHELPALPGETALDGAHPELPDVG
jgi:hypothetical protein